MATENEDRPLKKPTAKTKSKSSRKKPNILKLDGTLPPLTLTARMKIPDAVESLEYIKFVKSSFSKTYNRILSFITL